MRSLKSSRYCITCTVSLWRRGPSVELLPASAGAVAPSVGAVVDSFAAVVASVAGVVASGGAVAASVGLEWTPSSGAAVEAVGLSQPSTMSASNCHRTQQLKDSSVAKVS
jgi:hypothetical protein